MVASVLALLLGVIGVAVALARELARGDRRPARRAARDFVVTSLAWPFFLPSILARAQPTPPSRRARPEDRRLDRAEAALARALAELDGVARDALRAELPRLGGLAAGLRPYVARVSELADELARPECDRAMVTAELAALEARGVAAEDPRARSLRARAASLEHLAALHARAAEDVERALLELEELVSALRLLRFAGPRPGDGALDRLRHLAGSVAAVRDALAAAE